MIQGMCSNMDEAETTYNMSGGQLVFLYIGYMHYAIFEGESIHGFLNLTFVLAPAS